MTLTSEDGIHSHAGCPCNSLSLGLLKCQYTLLHPLICLVSLHRQCSQKSKIWVLVERHSSHPNREHLEGIRVALFSTF